MKQYHIHVNGYQIDGQTVETFQTNGFVYRPSHLISENHSVPLGLFIQKVAAKQEAFEVARRLKLLLEDDEIFQGYIEVEGTCQKLGEDFEIREFSDSCQFPFQVKGTTSIPRKADIHVYRPIEMPSDALDDILLQHGFYEVRTPRSRIYTLLLDDIRQARRAHRSLALYFKECGGVKKIELEAVLSIEPIHSFKVQHPVKIEF